jgi:hypothetical protein
MSILSALKQQNGSIEELAKLPQAMIMQMAQKGDIREDMLAPILGKKAEMADAVARQRALQAGGAQQQPTVLEQVMAKNAMGENPAPQMAQQSPQMDPQAQQMEQAPMDGGLSQLPIPERQYAGGGIVAFDGGGMAMATDEDYEEYQQDQDNAEHSSMMDKLYGMMKNSYIGEKASRYLTPKAEVGIASTPKRGSHPYEDMVVAEAKKQGVDPQLALHVLYKETGGLKNPENARSKAGATGIMQLMPKTAKELGVNPNVPEENIYGGVKYLAKLGKMFDNDPRLVAAAYNAGPGNVRKHGGVPNFQETRNYVKGLAEGGIVGYAGGGMPLGLSSGEEDVTDMYPMQPKNQAEADYFQRWLERQDAARAASKAGAKEDTNLALLTAGLRTMAGTSPYAFANIGAGGAAGAEAYGASKRARRAEELAMDKMEIGALGAKTKQEQLNEYRTARLEESKRAAIAKQENVQSRLSDDEDVKRQRNITTAQGRAAQNPIYKNAAKSLENLDPSDPMYQYNIQVMKEIEDSYISGRGIRMPTPPAKVEKPGFMERIFGGSKSPGRMTFDQNGNPI